MTTPPEYAAAREAIALIAQPHQGQHRCVNGIYFRPTETCVMVSRLRLLTDTLAAAEQEAHNAVHDPDVLGDVARTTFGYADWPALTDEQRDAAVAQTRAGLEEFCRVLDLLRAGGPF